MVSSQFKLFILSSLACTSLFLFVQIVCFSRQSLFDKSSCNHHQNQYHTNSKQTPSPSSEPIIYIITPTYARYVQKAELTRLAQTLISVHNVHWILIEDSTSNTDLVIHFVNNILSSVYSFPITLLHASTPIEFKTNINDPNWFKPRGVQQRNQGLQWLRDNKDQLAPGVVYFADDDNTYDLQLFQEMRYTKKVSVWPVALVGGLLVEKPIVYNGKVIGWNTAWKPHRPYPIDMAGFAINLDLILQKPNANFSLKVPRGFQESHIIKQLIHGAHELEPKAKNCTQVFVWHTRTEQPKLNQEIKLKVPSNEGIEI